MKEIRFHGRGGQGVATAAEILAAALVREGNCAAAFPMFGFERRGAPVAAFLRVAETAIRERTQVYTPDCLIVLDARLVGTPDIYQGFKTGGTLVMNGAQLSPLPVGVRVGLAGAVRANEIAREELGKPAVNTAILGAFARITRWVSVPALLDVLEDYFEGKALAGNRRAVERGHAEAVVVCPAENAGALS